MPEDIQNILRGGRATLWLNEAWKPYSVAKCRLDVSAQKLAQASQRLAHWAGALQKLFPELEGGHGIIESPLLVAKNLQQALASNTETSGRWFIKADHLLPIAGSVKARGGIYEVLVYAEKVAAEAGGFRSGIDPVSLLDQKTKELFADHQVVVGSTGNLGLSIGITAAALGFRATVHMSADAKEWKKVRLRARGVEVVEHQGDFGTAVSIGRKAAGKNANAHFIDDENSEQLFLGYGVAAMRLRKQLDLAGVLVDEAHPLFVYIPCGVGGAPGGINYGLRHIFGDNVHVFFAEPVASPCMLTQLALGNERPISVYDIGLDNKTEADGLAVALCSQFVARNIKSLVSGIFTVPDDHLFRDLYILKESEGLEVEPSAAAALQGPNWILSSDEGRRYRTVHGLNERMRNTCHVLWTTGGCFVPPEEYVKFHSRGRFEYLKHTRWGKNGLDVAI